MTHRNFGIPQRDGMHIQYRSVDWFIPAWGVYVLAGAGWIAILTMMVVAWS